jgi:hypothetical protein
VPHPQPPGIVEPDQAGRAEVHDRDRLGFAQSQTEILVQSLQPPQRSPAEQFPQQLVGDVHPPVL